MKKKITNVLNGTLQHGSKLFLFALMLAGVNSFAQSDRLAVPVTTTNPLVTSEAGINDENNASNQDMDVTGSEIDRHTGHTTTCPAVGNPNYVDLSDDMALLSWNSPFTYDSIRFRYALTGTSSYRIVSISGANNPQRYFLTGLSSQTTYDVWIGTTCNGHVSGWGNKITFTTLAEPGPRFAAQNNANERIFSDVHAVPNPAQGFTNIIFKSVAAETFAISLINAQGKILVNYRFDANMGQNSFPLDIHGFAPGMYYVRVRSTSNSIQVPLAIL